MDAEVVTLPVFLAHFLFTKKTIKDILRGLKPNFFQVSQVRRKCESNWIGQSEKNQNYIIHILTGFNKIQPQGGVKDQHDLKESCLNEVHLIIYID